MDKFIEFIKKYKWGIIWIAFHIVMLIFGQGEDNSGFWPFCYDGDSFLFRIDLSPRTYDLGEFIIYVVLVPIVLAFCRPGD